MEDRLRGCKPRGRAGTLRAALDSLLQGRITAFAGHGSFHAYAGLHNHVENTSIS